MRDVRIAQSVIEALRMRDEYLAPKLAVGLTRRIHHQAASERLPNHREAEYPQLERDPACNASGGPHKRESPGTLRRSECEGGAP
jgi:hypothetical protein